MGKIIVIEANTDGAGKQTQSELLLKYFKSKNKKAVSFTFPNYSSDSSYFVKKYLKGDFGKNADKTNPFLVSTFFALDRALSFQAEIKKYYDEDYIIIFDRYVTSNMLYQASKITGENRFEKIDEFILWEEDLEYNKFNLPKSDFVIYLYIPLSLSLKLREKRPLKTGDNKDIHEEDYDYLKKVSETSEYVASKLNWIKIECEENGKIKSREKISLEIISEINL